MKLRLKSKELELERVKLARKELEFKIEEKLDEVNRIKDHIEVQEKREQELIQEIEQFKKENK